MDELVILRGPIALQEEDFFGKFPPGGWTSILTPTYKNCDC